MVKVLKNRLRFSVTTIGAIVDIYSLIQIVKQNSFKMPELLNNPWVWLFALVTVTMVALLVRFKDQDEKTALSGKIEKLSDEFDNYKKEKANEFALYRERVREEFIRTMTENSNLHKRINELSWKVEALKEEKTGISV